MIIAAVAAIGSAPAHGHAGESHDRAAADSREHADAADSHEPAEPAVTVTAEQQARADALVAGTARELARYADVAAAEAAGYKWIGDGNRPGGYRHYVSRPRTADPVVLDPAEVESLVYRTEADGRLTLVSGMYILPPGQKMTDVPDVAGELTPWHDHTFCLGGGRPLADIAPGEACPAGTRAWQSPPMLHVWTVDHPDGPFAAIDGHGAGRHGETHGG